ncbi:MAG: hypothetical protein WAT71_09405 [Ignavibacteria bacterium]
MIGEQYDEIGRNVIELRDKGYLMVGLKQVLRQRTNILILQSYIVKLDPFGNILWQKIIGDTVFSNSAVSAIEDKEGNIYLLYYTSNAHLMKLDALGNILWDKSYSDIVILRGVSFTNDFKNFVFLSTTYTQSSSLTSITKMDTSGNLIWNKSYPGPESGNNSFLFLDNEYYICGRGFYYGFIIKTDSSGNLLWNKGMTNCAACGNDKIFVIENLNEKFWIDAGLYNPTHSLIHIILSSIFCNLHFQKVIQIIHFFFRDPMNMINKCKNNFPLLCPILHEK